ncbi:Uncharacterised protein [Serratia ficaria]|nr:Uncharacterised protein [Serratia ficaria]
MRMSIAAAANIINFFNGQLDNELVVNRQALASQRLMP